jgi:peroxiredoxin
MARTDDLYRLPTDLPVPPDDGACGHLSGLALPSVPLRSTAGRDVDLSGLNGATVVYAYPRTGLPDRDPPPGWDQIPGARGCTPQACAFRDHHAELLAAGAAAVFGLSTQDSTYQLEAAERLHLPFELLSDQALRLTHALRLPTFEIQGHTLIKRLTLVLVDGRIEKVFYPVFPPDRNAGEVLAWLHYRRACELDRAGEEKAAAPEYELALELGLHGEDLRSALLGLGSTYRCLGEYAKAEQTLRRGLAEFTGAREFEPFLALTLHNRGKGAEAIGLLLRGLAETSADPGIRRYRRALLLYADQPDRTW